MSRRKVQYAKKCIDPEEEGEELPFEPREIVLITNQWVTEHFQMETVLGCGRFGEVRKCRDKKCGLNLAAKIITTRSQDEKLQVRKEINIMKGLHHPKILQIYAAYEKTQSMCIVMELLEGGELFERVVDPNFDLTERVAILFMRQIVDGMLYIHSQNVLHLDMKPENIICVAKTGTRIKIIDFGLAMKFNTGIKMMAGTVDFMAPEVCNFEDVSPATDMWSVGVICYVLVSGLSPFQGDDDGETISNILHVDYDFDAEEFEAITPSCKDFIRKLLIRNPKQRLTAEACLKHSWLTKITRAQTTKHLSKKYHMKIFARRKWMKVIRTVMAMNRLEKMSAKFMKRTRTGEQKRSRTPEPPTRVSRQLSQSDTTIPAQGSGGDWKKSEPSNSRYDWKANLEARKRQRERERQLANETKSPTTQRRSNQSSETGSTVGRIKLDKPTPPVSSPNLSPRVGRLNLGNNESSHARCRPDRENDTRATEHTPRSGRFEVPKLRPTAQERTTPRDRVGRLAALSNNHGYR